MLSRKKKKLIFRRISSHFEIIFRSVLTLPESEPEKKDLNIVGGALSCWLSKLLVSPLTREMYIRKLSVLVSYPNE